MGPTQNSQGEVGQLSDTTVSVADKRGVDSLPAPFRRYRSTINVALRERLADQGLPAYDLLRYSMGWSDAHGNPRTATEGKALRPTLCLLACEAAGGSASEALPAAVALELIHHFSLIHDDIQDRDEFRHHRPTVWAVWGDAKALVAGNILRAVAEISVWPLEDNRVPPDQVLNVASLLSEAYLEMIEGQYLDMAYEGRPDIGISDYMEMISRKTGALIRCALNVGAAIGSTDSTTVEAFRECGRSLGFVFQIRDDVLGVWGDEESTGKPVGADIRRKKNSLPVVYAISQAGHEDKRLLMEAYRHETLRDEDVEMVLEVMDRVKVRHYAQSLAEELCDQALRSLSSVEMTPAGRQEMEEIAHFLLVREH